MIIPSFIAFEVTNIENGYPYGIAWSLPDGQYKSVLVRPEDDWLIDYETGSYNPDAPALQDLLDQGQSVLDILREWEQDFDNGELFCQDPVLAQYCLDMMYDAYGRECDLDVIADYDCFDDIAQLDLDDQRRWIMDTEGLSASHCDDVVKTLIFLFARIYSEQ